MAIKKVKSDSFRETLIPELTAMFKGHLQVIEDGQDLSEIMSNSHFYIEDPETLHTAKTLAEMVRLSYPVVIVRLSDTSLTNNLINYFDSARFVFEYKGFTLVVFQRSLMFTASSLKTKFKVQKVLTIKGVE